jgi:hypothetical protein
MVLSANKSNLFDDIIKFRMSGAALIPPLIINLSLSYHNYCEPPCPEKLKLSIFMRAHKAKNSIITTRFAVILGRLLMAKDFIMNFHKT